MALLSLAKLFSIAKAPRIAQNFLASRNLAAAAAAAAAAKVAQKVNNSSNNNGPSNKDCEDDRCSDPSSRGLILGVYSNEEDKLDTGILTPVAWKYNKIKTNGRLLDLLRVAGPMPKRGEYRIFYNLEPNYSAVCIVGLGSECLGYNTYELMDEHKEAIRRAAATGCRALQQIQTGKIVVESFGHAESAAEGSALGVWAYQEMKTKQDQINIPQIDLHIERGQECDWDGWRIGLQKAAAQNLARQMQETPANLLSPTCFAQNVVEVLCKSGVNVEVKVKGWAESQQMHSFLSISKASCEPPIFLELSYYGTNREERPVVLVGQGCTYDAGGICLKDKWDLSNMRGDMSGAACVVAVCRAIASLQLPINIRGLIPLCENTLGCNACKPGDIVKTMNGKHVEFDDTSREDTLLLIDALLYAQNFWPKFILDVGTTCKECESLLCEGACGVFTNSEELWQQIKSAAVHTGDRVWRMPLWKYFTHCVTDHHETDVHNVASDYCGLPCSFAAFLKEFVPCGQWMHIDTRCVMRTKGDQFEYLRYGMAGRPTRTIIEFIAQLVCHEGEPPQPNSNPNK